MQDLLAIRFIPGTKISHDYQGKDVQTFSYRDLWQRGLPAIGIPCRQNNLLIVDVDVAGPTHQHDGREYWANFCKEFGVPPTYTVQSPSGGFHFYFKLPNAINPDTFFPPDELALGVDIKWNGWVGAPPTPGYSIYWGDLTQVAELPASLIMEFNRLRQGQGTKTFELNNEGSVLDLHRPFNSAQLNELRSKLDWWQLNAQPSRSEWRDGLFALKAGIEDEALLDEFIMKWTMNKSYQQGDENQARSIAAKADKFGPIGPGSIFKIMNDVRRMQGAATVETPFTIQEILDRSRVHKKIAKDGSLILETSESNAAAIIGAIFDETVLYHDIRSDLYIYKGKSYSDSDLASIFLPMLQSPAFGLGLEKFRRNVVVSGIDVLMASRRKDPHLEYLKSLKWDGVKRIETFFHRYVEAENSEYTRRLGVNLWTALAARGLRPGCKFDSMFVLEGLEGINKSSLIEAIAGVYTYAPTVRNFSNDLDILRQMHQSVITELPEMIGIVGQDPNFVKGFLSKPFDNIRSLFARKAQRNERGFILIGTTNQQKYLSLEMGARRFWPVRIPDGKRIDLSGIRADRDQLFAEGIQMFNDGHEFWFMPKELLAPIVSSKVNVESLIKPVTNLLDNSTDGFTTPELYKRVEAAGFLPRGYSHSIVARLEKILTDLEYKEIDGAWYKEDKSAQLNSVVNTMKAYVESVSALGAYL